MFKPTFLKKIYSDMCLSRFFEEKCAFLYPQGFINGFCHLYIGQEAVASAIFSAKDKKDDVITSYRCHVYALLAGESPEAVMGEMFGKKNGSSKGKGGSMHIFSPENNFWGGHGIVGAPVSLGTGLGFANKYQNNGKISIAVCGDGAMDQGQVYESYNMASLWGLPVLYVIENNMYSMGTSCVRHSSDTDFYKRGLGFGDIKGKKVNGMDFEICYTELKEAIDYVRENSKPFIIQMETYRFKGHSVSDSGSYRSKDELNEYKLKDPMIILKNRLVSLGVNQDDIQKIEDEALEMVDDAVEKVKATNFPDISELYTDVF